MAKTRIIVPILFGISFVFGQIGTLLFPNTRVSLLDICTLLIGLWFVAQVLVDRKKARVPHGIWIVLFAISVAISSFVSKNISENLLYLSRWVSYALLYGFIVQGNHDQKVVWTKTLYWSGVVLAVLGFLQLFFYPSLRNLSYLGWDPHLNRIFSTLFDPNFAGIIYVLTCITGVSLSESRQLQSSWNKAGILVAFIALLFTYSRSSYMAGIAAMIVWVYIHKNWKIGVGAIVVFLMCILILPRGGEGQNLLRTVSSYARLGSASVGWNRFTSSPIFGTGFVVPTNAIVPSKTQGIDMSLLSVLASTGVVGFIFYLAMWWHILQTKDPLLMTALAAVCVHSIFTNSLLYPWVMAWIWILAGVVERSLTADR